MRKSTANERAWFLEEESELRTQADFIAGKIRGLTYQLAWVVASVLLYLLLALLLKPRYRSGSATTALTVCFLVAWALLDARWQWQLWQQLQETYQQFAGKTPAQKRLAEIDGALFEFAQTLKHALPKQPSPAGAARVFIVSGGTSSKAIFDRLRVRYHLLPYNAYAAPDGLPPADVISAGDYVLILQPYTGIQYDNQAKRLAWDQTQLAVEPLVADELGVLFRVGSL